ncbi:MAG: biosynthetic arginine decarboxylase [Gammaproteobacteria bacterium]|nr:biosynthetic arginine decarboxylase [Gammaproteobacteria bacterium]
MADSLERTIPRRMTKPAHNSQPYRLDRWAEGYFGVNREGEVAVSVKGKSKNAISLSSLVKKTQESGLQLPILMRFTDILKDRLNVLCEAFQKATVHYNYEGKVQIFYPVKVNQHQEIIQTILNYHNGSTVGLEVGSKAEMVMVLGALKRTKPTPVICNGYKDRSMIRLGIMGQRLGHPITFVIEKPSELSLILEETRKEKLHACDLGVRIRLCATGKGNWQNTGGEKSKFGLSATAVLDLIHRLKAEKALECLKLLHFHLGSQISDLEDLKRGVRECAQFYVQLRQLGVPIDTCDVGGGLAVDYEGMASPRYFSMNYTIEDYAMAVVSGFSEMCQKANLPHPHIVTESGRAITAHHAVLITNVVNRECALTSEETPFSDTTCEHPLLSQLKALYKEVSPESAEQIMQAAETHFEGAKEAYLNGKLSLRARSQVEQLLALIYSKIKQVLTLDHPISQHVLERLAEKWVCNFSVFQSVPDVWGIDQIFPILPLSLLNASKTTRCVIQDITCDSDGRIDHYVNGTPESTTLSVPSTTASLPLIGIFLVGAYQEILGDRHNLFGNIDSVSVEIDLEGHGQLKRPIRGDTIADVLAAVHFNSEEVQECYRKEVDGSPLTEEEKNYFKKEFENALSQGTYLERVTIPTKPIPQHA